MKTLYKLTAIGCISLATLNSCKKGSSTTPNNPTSTEDNKKNIVAKWKPTAVTIVYTPFGQSATTTVNLPANDLSWVEEYKTDGSFSATYTNSVERGTYTINANTLTRLWSGQTQAESTSLTINELTATVLKYTHTLKATDTVELGNQRVGIGKEAKYSFSKM